MFERFSKPAPRKQEHVEAEPQQEVTLNTHESELSDVKVGQALRERRHSQENALQARVRERLLSASPETLRSKTAHAVLAASVLFGASSAYGQGNESVEADDFAPATSPRFALEFSQALAEEEKKEEFTSEVSSVEWINQIAGVINTLEVSHSSIFEGLSESGRFEVHQEIGDIISGAVSSSHFLEQLESREGEYSDAEKASALQYVGEVLGLTYNYDMIDADEYVTVSDDVMFSTLQSKVQDYREDVSSGICGNIHTYLMKTAHALGMEAWLQNGSTGDAGHIWMGTVLGSGDSKQIVFIDYGALIPTGTLNYKDALGIAEQYHGAIHTFNAYVGVDEGVMLPVSSQAQDVMSRAANIDESSAELLETELSASSEQEKQPGLRISIDNEEREIALSHTMIGIRAFEFTAQGDDSYQALQRADAVGVHVEAGRWGLRGKAAATVLNITHKDLEGGRIDMQQIVTELTGSYIAEHQMTRNEYGTFTARFGATVRGVLAQATEENVTTGGGITEQAWGGRMIYLDPSEQHTLYIGAHQETQTRVSDYQDQEQVLAESERSFSIGGSVNVYEGTVLGAEGEYTKYPYGTETALRASADYKDISFDISHERTDSEYERFVPSSVRTEVGLEYTQPRWQISVIGAKAREQYQDTEHEDALTAEVKLRINIW